MLLSTVYFVFTERTGGLVGLLNVKSGYASLTPKLPKGLRYSNGGAFPGKFPFTSGVKEGIL
jgi:hypothetical protein